MATTLIKEHNRSSVQDTLATIVSNLWKLFRRNVAAGNTSEANKNLMNIAKLKGLEQYTINHVIEDKRELETLSDEDLTSLLEGKDE